MRGERRAAASKTEERFMRPVRSIISRSVPALLLAVGLSALAPGLTLAHERRDVGKYLLVVGFNAEPAIQGEPNAATVRVTVPSEDNRAVTGLADTLKVNVAAGGGQPKEFPLRAVFGQPGLYAADFIPTRPGDYIFNFSGNVEGMSLNERFESGPGRFDVVKPVEEIQFPEAVPAGNTVARAARAAEDRAAAAESSAENARNLAVAGLGVGIVGFLVAAVAIVMAFGRTNPATAARKGT
jgi:hypothetical protein